MDHALDRRPPLSPAWPRWAIWLLAAAIALIFDLYVGYGVRHSHTLALKDAQQRNLALARLAAANLSSQIESVDKILAAVNTILNEIPLAERERNPRLLGILRQLDEQISLSRALTIIGEDGITRYATHLTDPFTPVNLSDRSYVLHHRDHPKGGLFISPPIQSRADRRWVVTMSRRLEAPNGRYLGLVTASVDLAEVGQLLAASRPQDDTVITLLNHQGQVLTRTVDHDRYVGTSVAGIPGFKELAEATETVGELRSPLDDKMRLYGYSAAGAQPIGVAVSNERDRMLEPWRESAWRHVILGLGLSLAVFAAALLAQRWLEQQESQRHHAEAANQMKSDFLANMSHELRTPLNAILGFSDALRLNVFGTPLDPRTQEYLNFIHQSGTHLLAVVNDILDMSKIEAGRLTLSHERVALNDLVESSLLMVLKNAEQAEIDITIRQPMPAVLIRVDELRFKQILINLLSNAVKFTPAGGQVAIGAELMTGGGLRLSIADTGIGMSPEHIATALTPFGQVSSVQRRSQQGTGLGLPLVQRLVELHGGYLKIESALDQGTTVSIMLGREAVIPLA